MPRFAKSSPKKPQLPIQDGLAAVVRELEQEAALWNDVKQETRLNYEKCFEQLKAGWEMGTARKQTRYVMRAAGLYMMRKNLRAVLREAKQILHSVKKGERSILDAHKAYAEKIAEGAKLLIKIRNHENQPWDEIQDRQAHYLQKDHKKRAATDEQLVKFYDAAKRSSFREAFLVCEFSGIRPEELKQGVRVEIVQGNDKSLKMRFFIESAKCDGKKKGLDIRVVEVGAPKNASNEVKARFKELARLATNQGKSNGWVCKIEPTEKQTVGQRITNAFKTTAKAAGVDVSAYSLRHRFSAQVKQASNGDSVAVALAMGHQTTETQRHYARASRGGGNVSPVPATGINVSGATIRGNPNRGGPPKHTKEHKVLSNILSTVPVPPAPFRRFRAL